MILTRKDLFDYMEQDAAVYGASEEPGIKGLIKKLFHPSPYLEYLRVLRKCEYYCNTKKLLRFWYAPKLTRMKLKTGIDVGVNVLDPGVHIPHGKIVVSSMSKVGRGG